MSATHTKTANDPPSPPFSVMLELRSQSHRLHGELEKQPCLRRLFCADYQLAEYAGLLARLYGFYAPLERQLFADLPGDCARQLAHRRKARLLAQDLAALGIAADELAVCGKLPTVASLPQKLGVCYVLEGATLGGRIIGRRLRQLFGAQAEAALSFYGCYGSEVDAQWHSFAALIEDCLGRQPQAAAQAAAAACDTFNCLKAWLAEG